jgi:hypothetical protein
VLERAEVDLNIEEGGGVEGDVVVTVVLGNVGRVAKFRQRYCLLTASTVDKVIRTAARPPPTRI